MTSDLINGLFEAGGAVAISASILRLLQDKKVKGVSMLHFGFFWVWGAFNIYFYPANNLWWSYAGGVSVLIMNSVYLYFLIKYRNG